MTLQVNIHARKGTTIERNLPVGAAIGGWIAIDTAGEHVVLYPPHDNPAAFWRYLSNVASDMAAYVEGEKGKS